MKKLEIGPNLELGKIDSDWDTMNVIGDCTIKWDLRNIPLPIPANTYDLIYMGHILEHVEWIKTIDILREIRRILKPNGKVEIWVPDVDKLIEGYQHPEDISKDTLIWRHNPDKDKTLWFNARMFSLTDGFKGEENLHRACFNEELLTKRLIQAGFEDIKILNRKPLGYNHGWINLGIEGYKRKIKDKLLLSIGPGIGNIIQATPAISALDSMGYSVSLYYGTTYKDAICVLKDWNIIKETIKYSEPIDFNKYDYLIETAHNFGNEHMVKFREALNYYPFRYSKLGIKNDILLNLELTKHFGYKDKEIPKPYCYHNKNQETEHYDYLFAPGINLNRYWRNKEWDGWVRLAKLLYPAKIVVLDANPSEIFPDNVINLAGKTRIEEIGAIIKDSDIIVSTDNGIAHMASALGKEPVIIFGPTDPIKCTPYGTCTVISKNVSCNPCQYSSKIKECINPICMDIKPDEVYSILINVKNNKNKNV